MLAKDLLINCFNCKNNVSCWGLDREIESDKQDPKKMKISTKGYIKNLKMFDIDYLYDIHTIASVIYIRSMFSQPTGMNDMVEDILQTSMCVIDALTNSSNDQWECPNEYEYIRKME